MKKILKNKSKISLANARILADDYLKWTCILRTKQLYNLKYYSNKLKEKIEIVFEKSNECDKLEDRCSALTGISLH